MPFEKGNSGRQHGAKNKLTLVKELLDNNLWDNVSGKITSEGIEKCWKELQTLKGERYVYGFLALMEYFKPKLARHTLLGDKDNPLMQKTVRIVLGKQPEEGE